jgi:predicted DNA-binding transcriptional regulator YafY
MNKFEKACIKERLLKLIKLQSTGTPAQLADKFEISERTVKRIISELRDEGTAVRYDHSCVSYIFENN